MANEYIKRLTEAYRNTNQVYIAEPPQTQDAWEMVQNDPLFRSIIDNLLFPKKKRYMRKQTLIKSYIKRHPQTKLIKMQRDGCTVDEMFQKLRGGIK